jgi:hypothetical protein
MILRRITKHVKEQNWTAIAIDFIIADAGRDEIRAVRQRGAVPVILYWSAHCKRAPDSP